MSPKLFLICSLLACLNINVYADPPSETANYYLSDSEKYLGRKCTLWLESLTPVGKLEDSPNLFLFQTVTFYDSETGGIANILVPASKAETFYKKHHNEIEQSSSVGTKSRGGWKASRWAGLLIKHEDTFYFYDGHDNPFVDMKGYLTLESKSGHIVTARIVNTDRYKAYIIAQNGGQIIVEKNDLNGESQRLVKRWEDEVANK